MLPIIHSKEGIQEFSTTLSCVFFQENVLNDYYVRPIWGTEGISVCK